MVERSAAVTEATAAARKGETDVRTAPGERELVSFVVPTFREPAIGPALHRLVVHLRTIPGHDFEILVVDDSEAEAQAKMRAEIANVNSAFQPPAAVRLIAGPRRGKGAAVRLGVQSAAGRVIFILAADLPVLLPHVAGFLETMRSTGADAVIGERSRDRYAGNRMRRVLARGLRIIQKTVVFQGNHFEDTQCGFKAFRADALKAIAGRQVVEGGMYDLEYLYAATLRRLSVRRVAVTSSEEVRPSRINVWRCLVIDPLDIVRLKVWGMIGHYR
jgi:glycosyltransferase involved in cell wall biosynthesis